MKIIRIHAEISTPENPNQFKFLYRGLVMINDNGLLEGLVSDVNGKNPVLLTGYLNDTGEFYLGEFSITEDPKILYGAKEDGSKTALGAVATYHDGVLSPTNSYVRFSFKRHLNDDPDYQRRNISSEIKEFIELSGYKDILLIEDIIEYPEYFKEQLIGLEAPIRKR